MYIWSRSHDQDGKPSKFFFSRTRRPMVLKLGMQLKGLKLYKVYINDDPGLTVTYFTASQIWSPTRLAGEDCYKVI